MGDLKEIPAIFLGVVFITMIFVTAVPLTIGWLIICIMFNPRETVRYFRT